MCGRFGLTKGSSRELADLLGVEEADLSFHRARYNIAPTQEHFVLVSEYERRKIIPARWGLVNRGAQIPPFETTERCRVVRWIPDACCEFPDADQKQNGRPF